MLLHLKIVSVKKVKKKLSTTILGRDADSLARLLTSFPCVVFKESSLVYYPKQMSIKVLKRWDLVINGEFRAVTEL